MRRRRKAKPKQRQQGLRELALAGRWEEVRRLLEERLARDPRDDEARAELERLQHGLPLRAMETALARKKRQEREMGEELQAELALYRSNPAQLDTWEPALLAKRRKRVALIRSSIARQLTPEMGEESALYLKALTDRLAERRGRFRLLRGVIYALLPIAGAALAATVLDHRAQTAETKLQQALNERDMLKLEHALGTADSGIYRLLNGDLPKLIGQAEAWKARAERNHRELEAQITEVEMGKGSVIGLSLVRRAALERGLRALPKGMPDLASRWQRLCRREQDQLTRQREEAAQRFRVPLPPLPELTGHPGQDEELLRGQQKKLRELAGECAAACELFGLDATLAAPMQARLDELERLLADIATLRRTTAQLPMARSYSQYCDILHENTPALYAPALKLVAIRDHLPDEDKLRDQMQDHGRQLPPGMLEAARNALLNGGPSFTPAFHANARQVYLMEEVFTSTALQKPLYEISAPTLPGFIIEERPEVTGESVSFKPSPLTPGFTLDTPRHITWGNPASVFIRRIDARRLTSDTGINRADFFRCGNLPQLLDLLLRFEDKDCPVLARAYVFNRLLEVMKAHEWPTMLGLAYAPTLRADIRSFAKLADSCGVPLTAGCWLQSTPEVKQAEEAFRQWFYNCRHHYYAREIARNFGALVQVHPRYVGFVDDSGQAQLYHSMRPGTLLWYLAEGGLTTTPLGETLEQPTPFSPVFIVEKD